MNKKTINLIRWILTPVAAAAGMIVGVWISDFFSTHACTECGLWGDCPAFCLVMIWATLLIPAILAGVAAAWAAPKYKWIAGIASAVLWIAFAVFVLWFVFMPWLDLILGGVS